jgi:hypothetical protein
MWWFIGAEETAFIPARRPRLGIHSRSLQADEASDGVVGESRRRRHGDTYTHTLCKLCGCLPPNQSHNLPLTLSSWRTRVSKDHSMFLCVFGGRISVKLFGEILKTFWLCIILRTFTVLGS